MCGDLDLERVAVVVLDVEPAGADLARPGTRGMIVTFGTVIGSAAEVGVVEVKPPQLAVVVGGAVHVRGPGDRTERQQETTAT